VFRCESYRREFWRVTVNQIEAAGSDRVKKQITFCEHAEKEADENDECQDNTHPQSFSTNGVEKQSRGQEMPAANGLSS
jgi:hypothetical protein